MNKLTLIRKVQFDGERDQVSYYVKRVVGTVRPYVGQILSPEYVADLCEQTGTWQITFIEDSKT